MLGSIFESDLSSILVPSAAFHQTAVSLVKELLDPLAASLLSANDKRASGASSKRKRGVELAPASQLIVRKIHTDGLLTPQVWEQARHIIDAGAIQVRQRMTQLQNVSQSNDGGVALANLEISDKALLRGEESSDAESDHPMDPDDIDDMDEGERLNGGEDGAEEGESMVGSDSGGVHDSDDDTKEDVGTKRSDSDFKKDVHGLNDGFFSIDDFNRETELLERQDALADRNLAGMGVGPDIEIDFDADPAEAPMPGTIIQRQRSGSPLSSNESDVLEPDGEAPPLKDDDLSDGSVGEDGLAPADYGMGMENTNDIMYEDFFGPAREKARRERRVPGKSSRVVLAEIGNEEPGDIQRTMDAVHRELFEDEAQEEDDDDEDSVVEEEGRLANIPGRTSGRQSTYERQKTKIAREIRRLEAENVANKPWMLSGEARAAARPINSLLEQDLDFERIGKPVPVITAEISGDIEAMIKRRIIAGEFDEVKRRRPDALQNGSDVRRGGFELSDAKPQQSLAEMYEEEYKAKADPTAYVNKADEATGREHNEILQLWKDLSAQLDGLSNFHYRPKPSVPAINIISNLPAITMEDARPSGIGGDIGSASMLAPQELGGAGNARGSKTEIMTKGGMPIAREELTREQKLRRRRRDKERLRKSVTRGTANGTISRKNEQKEKIVGDLKKGGVKVIGKTGELREVDGKNVKADQARSNTASFKL